MKQRFQAGDLVTVNIPEGSPAVDGVETKGIVVGSYNDQFGGGNILDYTVYLKGQGEVSWFGEDRLTLIERGRNALLKVWEKEEAAEAKQKGDLNWIFEHGPEVADAPHSASIATLAGCFGLSDMWGSRGEGITYMSNAVGTMEAARPYLLRGDRDGWLKHAAKMRAELAKLPPPPPQGEWKVLSQSPFNDGRALARDIDWGDL